MAELSPAARAVLDAIEEVVSQPAFSLDEQPPSYLAIRLMAAAALCALADHQQAPVTLGQPIDHWDPDERTRRELRNLADELEGADG